MMKLYVLGLLALSPALAVAGLATPLSSVGGSGPYTWTYSLQLTPDLLVQPVQPGPPPLTKALQGAADGRGGPSRFDAHALSDFSAQSIYDSATTVGYTARNFKGPKGPSSAVRSAGASVGLTQGPTANAVSEPGSLALAGLGLLVAGFARRGRGHHPPQG